MFKRYGKRLLAVGSLTAVLAIIAAPALYATGLWWGLPQIGAPAYCVGYSNYQGTASTGVGPTAAQIAAAAALGLISCNNTAPAGPTLFQGSEVFPVDIYGPAGGQTNTTPSVVYVGLPQVGQGPYLDVVPATTQTIPDRTPWFFADGTQGSGWTVTMPPNPIEGQIQRIVCEKTTGGTLTVAANTSQTLLNNPNTTCAAGTGYAWRYVAVDATWYRFQ